MFQRKNVNVALGNHYRLEDQIGSAADGSRAADRLLTGGTGSSSVFLHSNASDHKGQLPP